MSVLIPKACAVVCVGAVSLFKVILPSVKVARVTELSESDSFIGKPPPKFVDEDVGPLDEKLSFIFVPIWLNGDPPDDELSFGALPPLL